MMSVNFKSLCKIWALRIWNIDKRLTLLIYIPFAVLLVVIMQRTANAELCGDETEHIFVFQVPSLTFIALGQTLPRVFYLYIFMGRIWVGYDMHPEYRMSVIRELFYFAIFAVPTVAAIVVCEWGKTNLFGNIFGFKADVNIFFAYFVGCLAMVAYQRSRARMRAELERANYMLIAALPIIVAGYFFESLFLPNIYPTAISLENFLSNVFSSSRPAETVRDALSSIGYHLGSISELILVELTLVVLLPVLEKTSTVCVSIAHSLSTTTKVIEDSIPKDISISRNEMIREYERRYAFITESINVIIMFEFDRYRLVVIGAVMFNIDSVWVFALAAGLEYLRQIWFFFVKFQKRYIMFTLDSTYPEQTSRDSELHYKVVHIIEKVKPIFSAFVRRINLSTVCRIIEQESWEKWFRGNGKNSMKRSYSFTGIGALSPPEQAVKTESFARFAILYRDADANNAKATAMPLRYVSSPDRVIKFAPSFRWWKIYWEKPLQWKFRRSKGNSTRLRRIVESERSLPDLWQNTQNQSRLNRIRPRVFEVSILNAKAYVESPPCIDSWSSDKHSYPSQERSSSFESPINEPWVQYLLKEVQFVNFLRSSVYLPTKILGTLGFVLLVLLLKTTTFADLPTFKEDDAAQLDGTTRIGILSAIDILFFAVLAVWHQRSKFYPEFMERFDAILTPSVMMLSIIHSTQLLFALSFNRFMFGSYTCDGLDQIPTWLISAAGLLERPPDSK